MSKQYVRKRYEDMELRDVIASMLPNALREPDAGFIELGATSNLLIIMAKVVSERLSYYVAPTLLLEYHNLRSLSAQISDVAPV